jgi:hypothetical protein
VRRFNRDAGFEPMLVSGAERNREGWQARDVPEKRSPAVHIWRKEMRARSIAGRKASALKIVGGLALAGVLSGARADAATIVSSLADYEPRLTRPTGSNPGEQLAIDPNIDTPSDATTVRVGGQSRFRFTSAFFFALPALNPGDTITNANLQFTQGPDGSTVAPLHNVDLRGVGVTQDVLVANDPDAVKVDETANPALSDLLYNDQEIDTRAAIGTTVPRTEIQENFLTPSDTIATGGAQVVRNTDAAGDLGLAAYMNALYAAGVPAGSFMIITLNADAPPNDAATSRYLFASANDADLVDRPTLTFDVLAAPEPAGFTMLAIGAVAALGRRTRRRLV